jgi:predicted amidophosphoribosyltransferase
MQGFAAHENRQKQPIGPERTARLYQLTHRIIGPMQGDGMDDQVKSGLGQIKQLIIRPAGGLREGLLPKIRETGDNRHLRKGFVNQFEPILDLISGGLVQKQRGRRGGTLAVADQSRAISKFIHDRDNKAMASGLQTALRLIYPSRCTVCGDQVESDFGLCGPCWRDTPFIAGLVCEACGVPLPGEADEGQVVHCDECLRIARPWQRGRAALLYKENGRRLVLALKHGDRHDVVRPAALWMARAARPLLVENMLIAPVPLHWTRMLKRRFNQAALLAQAVADQTRLACCPDLLARSRKTKPLEGMGFDARHQTLHGALTIHPKRKHRIAGRHVLIVDDVMTSGATFSAAAQACFSSGAKDVSILALARVAKDD